MIIVVENVSRSFKRVQALRHIHFEIQKGATVALVGGSGSGKSTLLRLIAGLDAPDSGSIWLNGINAASLSVQERRIGFVSQSYALFPNMSVFENIAFGLFLQNKSGNQIKERVEYLLRLIELDTLRDHFPDQLSGGQRQRVALARALAPEPKVLLLDEPFAALDMRMRAELRDWFRSLRKRSSVTIVLVTHDYKEALEMATQIIMLKDGRVELLGEPEDFYKYYLSKADHFQSLERRSSFAQLSQRSKGSEHSLS